jgi:thiamine biosynthesis protein ThiI
MMYRIAEKIAEKENAKFIVTGENLGQVASQTLDNLAVLEEAVDIPVLRPLLCLDKEEIVNIAKEIRTYSLAKNIKCPFVPGRPATKAALKKTREEELKIDTKNLIKL